MPSDCGWPRRRCGACGRRSSPARRPGLLYGFDDLSPEQIELVAALAESTEVTVAVTYEDRAVLTARAGLRSQLAELGGTLAAELKPDPANTRSDVLFHLERSFLE